MSNLITYPDSLPRPLLSSLAFKQQSNVLRTEMDSGTARVRKRFSSVPTFMDASWKINATECEAFEGFIEHALNSAVNWFVLAIKTPQGLVEHDVRFVQNPMENYKPISKKFWEYSANIEIKKRKVPTEERTAELLLEPNTTDEFVTGVSDALDNYQG
jgi:hypothetical protein